MFYMPLGDASAICQALRVEEGPAILHHHEAIIVKKRTRKKTMLTNKIQNHYEDAKRLDLVFTNY